MKSEFLTDLAIVNGLKRGYLKIIDDELNKKCSCCLDYFPCDLDFFHSDGKNGKLKSKCKPCWEETKHSSQIRGTRRIGRPRNQDKQAITCY